MEGDIQVNNACNLCGHVVCMWDVTHGQNEGQKRGKICRAKGLLRYN